MKSEGFEKPVIARASIENIISEMRPIPNDGFIICDTNVWYSVDHLVRTDPRAKLCGTLINLLELCRTPQLRYNIDTVRLACKQLVQRNKGICVYSPFKSIAVTSGLGIEDGNEKLIRDCMTFIVGIAEGDDIDSAKLSAFDEMLSNHRKALVDLTSILNDLVDDVRAMKPNKRNQNRSDLEPAKKLITRYVSASIEKPLVRDDLNWDEIELFLHTLNALFLDYEVSRRKWQPNDINDLFNLAYVGSNDLYWTLEKRWITIIKSAGMQKYLFSLDGVNH